MLNHLNKIKLKIFVLTNGLSNAFHLNLLLLSAKLRRKKTIVFHCSYTQISHIKPIIEFLFNSPQNDSFFISILCPPSELRINRNNRLIKKIFIFSEYASRFLLFCDMMISVDQGMIYPWIKCKYQICLFHGQPSKGNPYQYFNPYGPNILIFYGPLMRDYYLKEKSLHPEWPEIQYLEIGQPLSDRLFNNFPDKVTACKSLSIDPEKYTILYAPSFEYCSSFAINGQNIINCLLSKNVNLIVKPHPAFYNNFIFKDTFNQNIPNIKDWAETVNKYAKIKNCIFPSDNTLNMQTALAATDIMITDYSGVAFDGILLDKKMIYWDCPAFFNEYLPQKYGLDPVKVKLDLACNVGRNAGIVVDNCKELVSAINFYIENPNHLQRERHSVSEQLLFNPGKSTETMVNKIYELLELNKND